MKRGLRGEDALCTWNHLCLSLKSLTRTTNLWSKKAAAQSFTDDSKYFNKYLFRLSVIGTFMYLLNLLLKKNQRYTF